MTAGPTNVSFYADPKGLAALKSDAKARDPGALKEVAKQFESLFTQMLLKSMREANKSLSDGDSLLGSEQGGFLSGHVRPADGRASVAGQRTGTGRCAGAPARWRGLTAAGGWRPVARRQERIAPPRRRPTYSLQPTAYSLPPAPSLSLRAARSSSARCCRMPSRRAANSESIRRRCWRRLHWKPDGESRFRQMRPAGPASICSASRPAAAGPDATVNVPTLEFEDGVAVRKVDRFRSYASAGGQLQ